MSSEISSVRDDSDFQIDQQLSDLVCPASTPSIFRVDEKLRSISGSVYDPQSVAIGPLHRDKPSLLKMECHKKRYLKELLQRRNESSAQKLFVAVKDLEEKARKCYDEPIAMDKDEFAKMLMFDGVFIIDFLQRYPSENGTHPDKLPSPPSEEAHSDDYVYPRLASVDPLFRNDHSALDVLQDLLQFENQIPFFVIEELGKLLLDDFEDEMQRLLSTIVLRMPFKILEGDVRTEPFTLPRGNHLLDMVYQTMRVFIKIPTVLPPQVLYSHLSVEYRPMVILQPATSLNEAGVVFEKKEDTHWLKITFDRQKLSIPPFQISDTTEHWLRNFMACEYYLPRGTRKLVRDYIIFMFCLVRSPNDAEVLQNNGIISNILGGDRSIYQLINKLGQNMIMPGDYYYSDTFRAVNHFCGRRRNIWMAILRRDYFGSPWSLISLIVASFLVLLTIVQTVIRILSYRNDLSQGN